MGKVDDLGNEAVTILEACLYDDLYTTRKKVGELYKILSGKAKHYSDCATNNAPAFMPKECDCGGNIRHG